MQRISLRKRILMAVIFLFACVCLAAGVLLLHGERASAFSSSGSFTAEEQTAGSKFASNGDLLELYKIPAEAITYTNNGGGEIAKAFDGDFGTQWTSVQQNTRTDKKEEGEFTNEVTVTFSQDVKIDRVLYQASDARVAHGYPTQLELQYAAESGDFTTLGVCTSSATVNRVIFKFSEVTCRRFKLVFREVNKAHNWVATAKEIVFLTPEDENLEKLAHLFSDYAETQLEHGIDEAFITKARTDFSGRLNYKAAIEPLLDRAESIVKGTFHKDTAREYGTGIAGDNAIARYGDIRSYCANTLKMSTFGVDYQPTGIAAISGTKLTVYVEAGENDPLPNIIFTQSFGDWRSWLARYRLARGKNVFTVPNFITENYTAVPEDGITPGGPVYLENPYTAEQQSDKLKVYIEGGEFYPLFRKGGDTEKFEEAIVSYKEKMEEAPKQYADVAEIASDHVLATSVVSSAYELFVTKDYSVQESCEGWDGFMEELLGFGGVSFEEGGAYYAEINRHLRHNLRLTQPWAGALAYAAGGFCGFCMGAYRDDFWLLNYHQYGWAMPHELGHAFDNNMGAAGRTTAEVTNNMWAIYNRNYLEKNPEMRYNADVFRNELAPDREPQEKPYVTYCGTGYVFWWLIESRYPGFWGKMENLYRYRNVDEDMAAAGVTDEEKKLLTQEERHAYLCSLAAETDLTYYFDRWGFYFNTKTVGEGEDAKTVPASQFDADALSAAYTKLMQYAGSAFVRPQLKFWYMGYWDYNYVRDIGKGMYTEENKVTVADVFASAGGYTVILPEETNEAHLGYEIVENGRVIGFTAGAAFTDRNEYPKGYVPSYSVRAYDRLLNCSALSSSVSPAAEQGDVCKIGETKYPSLAEAFAAAAEGDVIELIAEARSSAVTVERSVTLAGSFAVLRGETGSLFTVKSGAKLTLQGGDGERNALRIDGGKFSQDGALIRVEQGGELVSEGSVILENNYSTGDGGAIFASGALTLNGTVFLGNRAKNGGAIREDNASTKSVLTGVRFENNTASEDGGAVSQRGTMTFEGCAFVANAARSGGAVCNFSGGVIYCNDARVERNIATEKGGGFCTDGYADFKGGTFLSNRARQGGGIYFAAGNNARKGFVGNNGETPIKFKTNHAEQGGALYINSAAPVAVSAIAVAGNRAEEAGGGVLYLEKGGLTFPNTPTEIPDFVFEGWKLNGESVTEFSNFAEGSYLDAEGVTSFYVTFYVDGAAYGDSTLYSEGSTVVLPELSQKMEKRRFLGWSVNGTLAAAGETVAISEDISAEAVFRNEYDATVSVGGEVTKKQTVLEGDPFVLPEAPEAPEGKVFKGWQVHSTLRAPGDEVFLTGDVDIHAVFEDIPNQSLVLIVCVSVAAAGVAAMAGVSIGVYLHHRKKRAK